ncbi:MAG TPA: hypothetical protein VEJ18_09550, partial [Planctomycetota bacterium]|nr:hypothetical protein [Planctomycetota bacterium]
AGAMLAYLRGQADDVRARCAEAIRRYGRKEGVEEFHWLRGLVEDDRAAATRCYDQALAIRPRFPLALYSRAWSRGGGGFEDFDAAIRCAPGFAEAYIFRGSALLGDPRKAAAAAADFDVLVRRGLYLAPAYNGRGAARLKLGQLDAAIEDVTEAIRLKPDGYHIPWVLRAEARLAQNNPQAAVADATRALEILGEREGRERCLVVRGRARALLGERAGAVADLRSAGPSGAPFLREIEQGR